MWWQPLLIAFYIKLFSFKWKNVNEFVIDWNQLLDDFSEMRDFFDRNFWSQAQWLCLFTFCTETRKNTVKCVFRQISKFRMRIHAKRNKLHFIILCKYDPLHAIICVASCRANVIKSLLHLKLSSIHCDHYIYKMCALHIIYTCVWGYVCAWARAWIHGLVLQMCYI